MYLDLPVAGIFVVVVKIHSIKYTVSTGIEPFHAVVHPSPPSGSRTLHLPNLRPCPRHTPSPPPAPGTTTCSCLHGLGDPGDLIYVESCISHLSVSGLFHVA